MMQVGESIHKIPANYDSLRNLFEFKWIEFEHIIAGCAYILIQVSHTSPGRTRNSENISQMKIKIIFTSIVTHQREGTAG